MDTLLRVSAVLLLGALLFSVLKPQEPAFALLLCAGILLALCLPFHAAAEEALLYLRELADAAGLEDNELLPVLKCTLIAVITKLGAELCRDSGVQSFAGAMELAGTMAAFLVSLPLLRSVFSVILDML